jgi:hypothetical protein
MMKERRNMPEINALLPLRIGLITFPVAHLSKITLEGRVDR